MEKLLAHGRWAVGEGRADSSQRPSPQFGLPLVLATLESPGTSGRRLARRRLLARRSALLMLPILALSFAVATAITLLIIRSSHLHGALSADHDLSGPQKFHSRPVPRIGGLAIFGGFAVGTVLLAWRYPAMRHLAGLLLACSVPAFLSGVIEDLTKRVSPLRRMLATLLAAALGAWLLGAQIKQTSIPGLDWIAATTVGGYLLALLVVALAASLLSAGAWIVAATFSAVTVLTMLVIVLAASFGLARLAEAEQFRPREHLERGIVRELDEVRLSKTARPAAMLLAMASAEGPAIIGTASGTDTIWRNGSKLEDQDGAGNPIRPYKLLDLMKEPKASASASAISGRVTRRKIRSLPGTRVTTGRPPARSWPGCGA